MADHHDCPPVEARQATDHGAIVAIAPIAVQLDKILTYPTHIVERVRSLRVACELDLIPRCELCHIKRTIIDQGPRTKDQSTTLSLLFLVFGLSPFVLLGVHH